MAPLALSVQEVLMLTPTVSSIRLSLKDQAFSFQPGQYCLVEFSVDGTADDRALSIANFSDQGDSLLFATRLSESPYKKTFNTLQAGDPVSVMGPMGDFVYDENATYTVMLAGGIGITPFKSMIEYACAQKPNHRVILLYANSTVEEIAFRQELEQLDTDHPNFTLVNTLSNLKNRAKTWQGHTGRIDEALIRQYVTQPETAQFFICGPPAMVSGMEELLSTMGLSKERIQAEKFSGYR